MNIENYYSYQAIARGLYSQLDVEKILKENNSLYTKVLGPWIPKNKNAIILEVACGPGIFLRWLNNRGYKNVFGSDSSDVQIALASVVGLNVDKKDAILDLISRQSESIDCIVALDFYEHLSKEVFLDFINECNRVLKHGGKLILRGPNGDSPVFGRALYNDITHQSTLTSTAFTAVLKMLGYSDVEFKDVALASIKKLRWIKVPISFVAQLILRGLILAATRENIKYTSASFFICATK